MAKKSITAQELDVLLNDNDHDEVLIDVRTPAEYKGGHIKEAENEPLSNIEKAAEHLKGVGTVYVSCGSGMRSKQACDVLRAKGVNVVDVQGGLTACIASGKFDIENTSKSGHAAISIIRQVMIAAGSLVLIGIILGDLYSKYWYLLSIVTGGGLLFAGVTGICAMTAFFSKMPWNK